MENNEIWEDRFVRIATTYYKTVMRPNAMGELSECRMPWSIEAIRQDYGKDFLANIPKYDGFCCVPAHIDYKPVVGTFLNRYSPISHIPMPGEWPTIEALVRHIFGSQYDLGLDYLQLLYTIPLQKLPILLLVSEERNTGKSTFLNFLKALFEANVTFNTNESFRSQFNSDWNGKLIIVVDEVLLNKREDSERLKNLSTTYRYKMEAKGQDREEVSFFAKFVLCSNNEYLPVVIDPGETRYWVRKIERLQHDDTAFLDKVRAEIPAFLHHLSARQLSTTEKSRMWFDPALTDTEALQRIIRANRNRVEIELAELLMDIMVTKNVDSVSFCMNDILNLFDYQRVKADRTALRKVIQECWKLSPAPNSLSYTTYQIGVFLNEPAYVESRKVGRFYTVTRQMLDNL
ncbi:MULTISPECIES: primase-helicase family protein [Bacteroidales]|uniref:primase-helicase family protein n=1 Tax=Bacteroidales TaxID=171549 RepID=UPI000F4982CB|nr:primase-helicase family protein [Paramuribaculum intestinale]ROT19428.1 helicase [Muribaculaceae bacterium Isolate-114 (HZI)]ROT20832.1 helicase [Muribaculaceae bacterium Isolate-113 (HZI)]